MVYFASRGASHEACRRILALKCARAQPESRSMLAVRGKLDQVRKTQGLWDEMSGWNLTEVDKWLMALEVEDLSSLVAVGKEELDVIPPVSTQDGLV